MSQPPHPPRFYSVGEVAKELGEPLHRISYIIRTRQVKPNFRAGNIRVFGIEDVEYIRRELARIGEDVSR